MENDTKIGILKQRQRVEDKERQRERDEKETKMREKVEKTKRN